MLPYGILSTTEPHNGELAASLGLVRLGRTSPSAARGLVDAEADATAGLVGEPDVADGTEADVVEALLEEYVGLVSTVVNFGEGLEFPGAGVMRLIVKEGY